MMEKDKAKCWWRERQTHSSLFGAKVGPCPVGQSIVTVRILLDFQHLAFKAYQASPIYGTRKHD